MNEESRLSDEMRGAFIDGQLDAAEWARIAERAALDPALREDLCELRMLKDMVRNACAEAPPRPAHRRAPAAGRWGATAAAAGLFALAGWFGHAAWERADALDPASVYALRGDWSGLRSNWRTLDANRVLVHVSSGRREALANALGEVEDLLRAARGAHRKIEVELVANSAGLDLLRANGSDYAARIAALRAEFPELALVACGQTLERRRAGGRLFALLPGTAVAPSALDEVVKRLKDGWVYVRA